MKNSNSLGAGAVKLTISKFISLFITMLTSMLLSRFRTLEEYGTYSQLLMVVQLATTIIMMGLPNSINYFLGRTDNIEERNHFVSVYYTTSSAMSILVGTLLVACTPLVVRYFDNPLISNYVYFLAIFPWCRIIHQSVENILVVYKKTSYIMIYRWANSIALLGIILVVKIFNRAFNIYMLMYIIVESLFAIWVYIITIQCTGQFKIAFDWTLVKKMLKFSIPIGIATAVGTLNIELDKLVIGGVLDTEQMAVYTNSSKELPVTIIATSVTAVLLPHMAKLLKQSRNEEAVSLWGAATNMSFSIISFLALALLVFAPDVMTILYSEKYISGVGVFRIYSLILLLRCTYFGMILNASGKTKFILYSSIGSLILNVILNYLFLQIFGFIGPAIATFISQLIVNLVQLYVTSKLINVEFKQIFPWKKLLKNLLINSTLAAVFFLVKNILTLELFIGEVFESIALGVAWTVVFIIISLKSLKVDWNTLQNIE